MAFPPLEVMTAMAPAARQTKSAECAPTTSRVRAFALLPASLIIVLLLLLAARYWWRPSCRSVLLKILLPGAGPPSAGVHPRVAHDRSDQCLRRGTRGV